MKDNLVRPFPLQGEPGSSSPSSSSEPEPFRNGEKVTAQEQDDSKGRSTLSKSRIHNGRRTLVIRDMLHGGC